MSMYAPFGRESFQVDNIGTNPSATPATSITPGASGSEGSYTQLLSALGSEVSGFYLWVLGGLGANKRHVLDLGVDPAGGSSYTAIITDLVCGASAGITNTSGGYRFFFPLRIPVGATVAARIRGSNATAGTVRVGIRAYGRPKLPWTFPVGQFCDSYGVSGDSGTSFTPGNAADGSYVSLGTVSRDTWWWQLGFQIDNATITAEYTYIELAWGDASNKHLISKYMHGGTTGESCGDTIGSNLLEGLVKVPAGANIYVRGRCNGAPDTGYQAAAYGVG